VIRFVVCGMGKEQIARAVQETAGDRAVVRVTSDFEAASAIASGAADVYIGACQSGAGGALAVAIAMLGWDRVVRLSGVGLATADEDQVGRYVSEGKRAFGIAHSHIDTSVPQIVRAVMAARAD
jgi:hypothetical protein